MHGATIADYTTNFFFHHLDSALNIATAHRLEAEYIRALRAMDPAFGANVLAGTRFA